MVLILLPSPSFQGLLRLAQKHFPLQKMLFLTPDNARYGYHHNLDRGGHQRVHA